MKMVHRNIKRWKIVGLLLFFVAFYTQAQKNETYHHLVKVNKNWQGLENKIQYCYSPSSEKDLVQLHLRNVISYLESQPVTELTQSQKENRLKNIQTLSSYAEQGNFPKNTLSSQRIPIFIDSENTHCAVGYLLKESGYAEVAKEIAHTQLCAYLGEINHPELIPWQQASGLSLFELALIQPTYGPPIPVCAAPSPVQWDSITVNDFQLSKLFPDKADGSLLAISDLDETGLKQEVKRYHTQTQSWTSIGNPIQGEILDLAICKEHIYLSVLLIEEEYPHQLLILNGKKWDKLAYFNGNITDMETFQNKLYVHGNFKKVNDNLPSNFIVVDHKNITAFNPKGQKAPYTFDHLKASESSLFLTSRGGIYQFKNDTIKTLMGIKYYQYIKHFNLDALADSLYVTSIELGGYNKYFDHKEQMFYMNNMMHGQNYPYKTIHFTQSKLINGRIMISGDFRSSTLQPQINDERYLVQCSEKESNHWYGSSLLYQMGSTYYPLMLEGITLDFVQVKNEIYVLKKSGCIHYSNLNSIEEKITQLRAKSQP